MLNYKEFYNYMNNKDINDISIDDDILNKMRGYFLDISSSPYGIDINKINKYKLKYDLYSSIPSKYAPDRAGKILLKKFGEDLWK